MTTTSLTSELEAVNTMLAAADEAPVTSLVLSGLYPLDLAKRILDETSRVVQSEGWMFNTEDDYPLSRNVSDNILVPGNVLKVDVNDEYNSRVRAVQRGDKLYDLMDHSYVFDEDLKATLVFLLPWDELPQPARHYIMIRAARTMQGRTSIPEASYRYSADDEAAALLSLQSHESDTGDHNMLNGSWSTAQVVLGREMW